jgi:HK97 family phage major capsid protein
MKERLDALQGKVVNIQSKNFGGSKVLYKGYNLEDSKNFCATLTEDESKAVAQSLIDMSKGGGTAFEKTFDGSYAVPEIYSSVLMGLAEYNSIGLSYMNVMVIDAPVMYMPVKANRTTTTDAQSAGTANAVATPTLGQITFTIDKYIGSYIEVLKSQISDANFDFINQFIIPTMGEGIGQYIDAEVFNGTNSIFTTSVCDATASVTASGASGIADAVTFSNLNTMYNSLSWDRGITNPRWFGPQGVYKDIMGLVGSTNDHPIFLQQLTGTPVKQLLGCPYVVTPVVANAPDDGACRLFFGDPRHYTIVLRGGIENLVNPYIKMKEHTMQYISSIRADGNITDNATASSTGAFTTMKRSD